ncbi:helix-turn-helix transcriptional regulator [bacterium]|nr:helix-turn-helix transcriptional regulator [bacterium]
MARLPKVTLSVDGHSVDLTARAHLAEAAGVAALGMCALAWLLGNWGFVETSALVTCHYALWGTHIVTLVVMALADKRLHAIFRTLRPVVIGSALCVAGALVVRAAGPLAGRAQTAAACVGGALLGGGMALLSFSWVIACARMDTASIVRATMGGMTLCVIAYVVILGLLPQAVSYAVVTLLPLAHVGLLNHRVTARLPDEELREISYFAELHVSRERFAAHLIPLCLGTGLALGLTLRYVGKYLMPFERGSNLWLAPVCALVTAAVILVVTAAARSDDEEVNRRIRLSIGVEAICALPLASCVTVTDASGTLPGGFVLITFCMVSVSAIWVFAANISQTYRLSPVFTGGLVLAPFFVGVLVAPTVSAAVNGVVLSGIARASATVTTVVPLGLTDLAIVLLALVVAASCFPRREDIARIVLGSYDPRTLHGYTPRQAAGVQAASSRGAADGARGAVAGAAGAGAAAAPATGAGVDQADGERPRKGRFVRRCQAVADTYMLSRRETDVLFLLAKGHNVSYIMEHLVISEGTAKTHVHHVYQKLSVHSQQELIQLVESTDVPEW